jgi:MFS family permease
VGAPLKDTHHSPGRTVLIVCAAEILGMAPFSMFLALQPQLREAWQLSNTAAGWISSAYFTGYMVAVPVLVSLTDRYDARTIWLGSTTIAVGAALGFGLLADGVWTALLFQFLAGASLAGTYMPGLKLIADRVKGVLHPRFVAFYTTSFTMGASASFYAIGQLDAWSYWRTAVALSALGPAVAWFLAYVWLHPIRMPGRSVVKPQHHWRAVARSPDAMRYVLGYACHTWELFAVRAWLVPFLVFCEMRLGSSGVGTAATLAAIISLAGVPASVAGAELTTRIDRRRLITWVMLLSATVSVLFGLSSATVWSVILIVSIVHSATVSADSAALTSGLVAVSAPESRGAAMAIYSMAGFGAASAGSFAVGGLLDLLGGESVVNWTIAFAVIGAPNVVSAAVLGRARR